MPEFVFTMQELRKVVPHNRVLLDEITLAFLPGAKIGVLGPNGAGKSTLLRIMAGVETEFTGEAKPAPGLRVGYLAQEPELDLSKVVLGNVEEGVAEVRALLKRFEDLSARFAEPTPKLSPPEPAPKLPPPESNDSPQLDRLRKALRRTQAR